MLGVFGWLTICMCQFCHDAIILLILCLYTKLLFTCNTIYWNFSNFCLRDTFSLFTEMVFSTRMAQKSSSKKFLNMPLEKGKVLFNVLLIFSSWVAFLYLELFICITQQRLIYLFPKFHISFIGVSSNIYSKGYFCSRKKENKKNLVKKKVAIEGLFKKYSKVP